MFRRGLPPDVSLALWKGGTRITLGEWLTVIGQMRVLLMTERVQEALVVLGALKVK